MSGFIFGGGAAASADTLDGLDSAAFALLAGRAGGQVLQGGVAANEDLTIEGTAHATKATSYVVLQPTGGNVGIGTSAPGQAFDIAYGNLRFTPVDDAGAPAVAVAAGGGVDDGNHYYKVTFTTATGETYLGAGTATSLVATTGAGNNTVNLSNIPVSPAHAVTGRKIYRTKAGGTTYWLVATIANNTATTYSDVAADATLTGEIAVYRENTTAGLIYNGADLVGSLSPQGQVGFGYRALRSATSGIRNTAVGAYALELTTSGKENVAAGTHALNSNTTGSNNVAIGFYASEKQTTAIVNTSIGSEALRNNVTGTANVAIGWRAANAALGGGNTAIGYRALALSTGGFNVAIGSEAGYEETGSNKLYIDNQGRGSESNGRTMSLVYGVFAPAVANQELTFNAGKMGFFGTAAVAKPTGVAVTAEGIHAALVTLGLIAA